MRTSVLHARWLPIGLATLFAFISVRGGCAESKPAESVQPPSEEALPSILTTAEQIHRLAREEAARAHRAIIRGIVTCKLPDSAAMVVQDSTRGLYVDWITEEFDACPTLGELVEVEGITDPGEFAPQLHALRITCLGEGEPPQPTRPTWDQLINGSLDTEYVEIQGVVTSVRADSATLLTHGGKIQISLFGTNAVPLPRFENSLIRLRGCLFACWDANTHQVRVGEIRMFSPTITIDEAAPEDPFACATKRAPELLLFDPQASALRRVKVSGQIVHVRNGEYFMMDGQNGLRFIPKDLVQLEVGDLVEVVGFPSLTGPCPILREVLARKTGAAALPPAKRLAVEDLFRAQHDATRVSIQAVLLSLSSDQRTLEMQAGLKRFLARWNASSKWNNAPIGSHLELTGVYAGHGGNPTTGAENDSFELLINSLSDISLIASPPWWTLRRLLILVGALLGVLAAALIWIRLLHHKVQVRTTQLQTEIRAREHAENQGALAQERARIARDLHDDLGSSLTEISMLATTSPGLHIASQEATERLGMIAGKSRTIIHALDEIVWAVDPQRDTLASASRYLASYAEEFLAGLNVACRVQIPNSFPDQPLPGEVRHHLFLAVKEALNNALRHASASEIRFGIRVLPDQLEISIADNGSGFQVASQSNGNGLLNLNSRLQKLGGQCEVSSSRGAGTSVCFHLPLPVRNTTL